MGIYDRDYERGRSYGDSPGYHMAGPRSMTVKLVFVTAAVYLAQLVSDDWVTTHLMLQDNWFERPWQAYQLLTYGFLHSQTDLKHILFNMYGLWLFGRDVEARYGQREFLVFYLAAIMVAGLVWSFSEAAFPLPAYSLGASGGTAAVMILFAFNFPRRTILLMFLFPMPMWALAVLIVGMDAMGAMGRSGQVAFTAHLGGAAFAFLYFRFGWRLSNWLPTGWKMPKFRRRPPLRVHDPSTDVDESPDTEVDDILRKIREQGQESLTRRERRILEQASRDYQKRKN